MIPCAELAPGVRDAQVRAMSIPDTLPDGIRLFDRRLKRRHWRRSAANLGRRGFLLERASADMAERLLDIERRFDPVLLQGARGGFLERALARHPRVGRLLRGAADGGAGDVVLDEEALP